jgi:hypothetical protein
VEKVTDTTYTLDDSQAINVGDGTIKINDTELKSCDGKISNKRMVIVDDNIKNEDIIIDEDIKNGLKTITLNSEKGPDGVSTIHKIVIPDAEGKGEKTIVMNIGERMNEADAKEFHEKMKAEGQTLTNVMVFNGNEVNASDGKKVVSVLMVKVIKVTELSPEDAAIMNKISGVGDQKLKAGEMKFYPNPANGKFNLAFDLPTKGDTEINIMSIEGKSVYSEKLPAFSGHYDKEIDISQNPKGTYFVKITQGDHTQVKKIVSE